MAGEAVRQLQLRSLGDEVDNENDLVNFASDWMKLHPKNDEPNDDMNRDDENMIETLKNKYPATATCLKHSNKIKFGVCQILKSYKQRDPGKLLFALF